MERIEQFAYIKERFVDDQHDKDIRGEAMTPSDYLRTRRFKENCEGRKGCKRK